MKKIHTDDQKLKIQLITQCYISGHQILSQRYLFAFSLGEMKTTKEKLKYIIKLCPTEHQTETISKKVDH